MVRPEGSPPVHCMAELEWEAGKDEGLREEEEGERGAGSLTHALAAWKGSRRDGVPAPGVYEGWGRQFFNFIRSAVVKTCRPSFKVRTQRSSAKEGERRRRERSMSWSMPPSRMKVRGKFKDR